MKKVCFITFAFVLSFSQAQTYIPLPMDSAYWQVSTGGSWASGGTCYCSYSFQYQTAGDTIIGSTQYTKIIHNGPTWCMCGSGSHVEGCIRQDTLAKKVYIIQKDSTQEYLLYDFSLNKGDTVKSFLVDPNLCLSPATIDSVDTVLICGKNRRRMHLNYACAAIPVYFIEGIGSTSGLIESPFSFEAGSGLDCAAYAGNNIYPDATSACNPLNTQNAGPTEENIGIFPNPASNEISISTSKKIHEIKIIDILGKKMLQVPNIVIQIPRIDVNTLETGIYFLSIDSGKETTVRKLVINR